MFLCDRQRMEADEGEKPARTEKKRDGMNIRMDRKEKKKTIDRPM